MNALLASLVAAVGLAAPPALQRSLVAGPALAGDRVVWGEQAGGLSVLRAWPGRATLWQSSSSWFGGSLAGSQSVIAFSRSLDPCAGQPGVACPTETETLAGSPGGSLRRLGAPERCSAAARRRVAVVGPLVARVRLDCDSSAAHVEVRDARAAFGPVFTQAAGCCDVSFAGSFLAWRSGGGVDVFDLHARRMVYRVNAPAGEPIAGFDVQADGKLALVLGPGADGRAELAWRTPGSQSLHRAEFQVVVPAVGAAVRFLGDRLVVERAASDGAELVVASLGGAARTLARFAKPVEQAGAFDAAAGRVTWASRRITSSRVDCPPPGQGRPCLLLKSGVVTVWTVPLAGGAPRAVARWSFQDLP